MVAYVVLPLLLLLEVVVVVPDPAIAAAAVAVVDAVVGKSGVAVAGPWGLGARVTTAYL
jgi:hypothetical protein